ncbi:MAG TPA: DUF47 family protein [Clostridia bacterium]|nr:DUF47 family protein [Clostridia bacterium]
MFKRKKKNNYFELLRGLVVYTEEAADFLTLVTTDYKSQELESSLKAMHDIEHSADLALHDMTKKLAREFITPIERQDILSIANMIDDVTDAIEDVLMLLYMFNVKELRDEAHEFFKVIVACSGELANVMREFENFRKSNELLPHIIAINDLEEEGDAIYVRCMRRLYEENDDPIDVIAWTEIFRYMEGCCDDFEVVSQTVEHVIMKNT